MTNKFLRPVGVRYSEVSLYIDKYIKQNKIAKLKTETKSKYYLKIIPLVSTLIRLGFLKIVFSAGGQFNSLPPQYIFIKLLNNLFQID